METELKKAPVVVYTESSPNPNSLKFVVNTTLIPETKSVDFPDQASAELCPMAFDLFKFNFVKRVFISSNFVTVTKDEGSDWNDLVPLLKPFVKGWIEEGKPLFKEGFKQESLEGLGAIEQKIQVVLDEYIRPAVESDGGNITFHSFEDGVVKVLLQGSCSGCPSSTLTLKAGIENLLTKLIPEVKSVVAEGV
jgi:NFU1 iron-sulfur cluster scaffold homolog, mitochondrial